MLGGMLAGTDEGGGKVITKFYETNELEYEVAGHLENRKHRIEQEQFVQFYGMSSDTAIRSACTYAGARKLKDLSKCTTFVRVNNQYNKIFENK
jgi:GMP reductase